MRLCIVSFKPCWQDSSGAWRSDGGFPLQISAIASLFDATTLVIVGAPPKDSGLPLPQTARVVPLSSPKGADGVRKLSLLLRLGYYVRAIAPHVRDADVVHVPVPGDISFLGLMLALVYRKRLIARYGSSWAVTPQTTIAQRVTRFCMRVCAGGRNVMLATGVGAAPPAPRMQWIFSTALTRAELQRIVPNLDAELASPPRLVYIGRLSPEKGVHLLIAALARVRAAAAHAMPRLTIIGDGLQRSALERQVDHAQLRGHVTFAGQADRERLSELLGQADLCVQPSLTEGFSKAWLDAMAHGVPVLSSNVGAAASVIGPPGSRGWLVPPGDEEALAHGLIAALDGRHDWPALRRRCRAFVEDRTLDAWSREIGRICVQHWGGMVAEGKLRV